MADHLTADEIAAIDATVARVHAERADAPTMAAKYDDACIRIGELHDETVRQRRRIEGLEDQLADARAAARTYLHNGGRLLNERDVELYRLQALADRRWVAWQSARRRATSLRQRLRFWVTAWKGLKRENATLRAQLAATTAPHRAEEQLAADAHPGTCRSPAYDQDGQEVAHCDRPAGHAGWCGTEDSPVEWTDSPTTDRSAP